MLEERQGRSQRHSVTPQRPVTNCRTAGTIGTSRRRSGDDA